MRVHSSFLRAIVRKSGSWGCGRRLGEVVPRGQAPLAAASVRLIGTTTRHLASLPLESSPSSPSPPSPLPREKKEVLEFTGLHPTQCPGFDGLRLGSLGMPNLAGSDWRRDLEAYFENGWTLTEVLFSALSSEGFYAPAAHGLRHPLIFYYGHPAALAVNKLRVAGLVDEPVNAYFERIFETGVDEMRWDDVVDPDASKWPSLDEVSKYRATVRDVVRDVLEAHKPLDATAKWCLAMICEHERIHLETSSVLIRELDLDFLAGRPKYWPDDHPSVVVETKTKASTTTTNAKQSSSKPRFRAYRGQTVALGKPPREKDEVETYGWDNEYGSRSIEVDAFEASSLITNGEFLEFVKAGGYADERYWTETGWQWRSYRNVKWPHFWLPRGPQGLHDYDLRLPFSVVPFQGDLPAEVNAHEARAFAKWLDDDDDATGDNKKPTRLLSEAQYRAVREQSGTLDVNGGDPALADSRTLREAGVNVNLAFGSPSAVVHTGTYGNVWQWCEDDFAALPGFKTNFLYEDFSTPCFDGEHTVIHGGSFASTGNEASKFARFHFRPHFHQHAGFRLARADAEPELTSHDAPPPYAQGWTPPKYLKKPKEEEGAHKYETKAQLAAYLDLHFCGAEALEGGPAAAAAKDYDDSSLKKFLDFPRRCAWKVTELSAASTSKKGGRALDVGCAVGGATFALAENFEEVVGIDFSENFVAVARTLAEGRSVSFDRPLVAGKSTPATTKLPTQVPNATFLVSDACDQQGLHSLGTFDAVLCANLLCRLPEPRTFVDTLPDIVHPGGVVLFVSPFSWLAEYTPDLNNWYTPAQLKDHMNANNFDLIDDSDMPLLIRDHARKYQLIFSNALAFKKKKF